MCCAGVCIVQNQPRKKALDHADYDHPTRQHELDHTDHTVHTDHTDQECLCPAWQIEIMNCSVGIDRLSDVWKQRRRG